MLARCSLFRLAHLSYSHRPGLPLPPSSHALAVPCLGTMCGNAPSYASIAYFLQRLSRSSCIAAHYYPCRDHHLQELDPRPVAPAGLKRFGQRLKTCSRHALTTFPRLLLPACLLAAAVAYVHIICRGGAEGKAASLKGAGFWFIDDSRVVDGELPRCKPLRWQDPHMEDEFLRCSEHPLAFTYIPFKNRTEVLALPGVASRAGASS